MSKIYKRHYDFNTAGRAAFRAVLVSDVHESAPGEIINAVSSASPDVIFVAGDLFETGDKYTSGIHRRSSPENAYEFLREASYISPVYYGVGNHDAELTGEMRERILKCGTVLLENADTEITCVHGSTPVLVGATT
ncbi:MAG: metallophosphoesterase, partial [Firmicutes bacterium]|nr:metallophosphoesterase [Bacillota bacterium]